VDVSDRPSSEPEERLFCSKPFTWFEVSRDREEGEVFLCCPSWLPKPIGNLTRQGVHEVWNGTAAQEIRASILDGSFRFCNHGLCPYLQTRTGPVLPVGDVADPALRDVLDNHLTTISFGYSQGWDEVRIWIEPEGRNTAAAATT